MDLRQDARALELLKAQGRTPVTSSEGNAAAKRIGARYMEASAKVGTGVRDVFELALKESMKNRGGIKKISKKVKCTVL